MTDKGGISSAGGQEARGVVFNIQPFSLHDGPGIRTTVFLKGCSLACMWCDNPESISPVPELGFAHRLCDKCAKCVPACPEGAIVLGDNGAPQIDRRRCTACGQCTPVCAPGALTIFGKTRSAEEVFQDVRRDASFYRRSGGGVTVSGGEPLRQSSFVGALFKRCREEGIHTAIETSGFVNPRALKEVLPYTDLVLYDLKHSNPVEHRRLTGRPNSPIVANAALVVNSGAEVLFRMPLIPTVNDTPQNIHDTALLLRELLGARACLELMPYHRLGMAKYEAIGLAYPLDGLESQGPEFAEPLRQSFEREGVRCLVSR